MAYEARWSATNPGPGCMIVLLDQSGSMNDAFGNASSTVQDPRKAAMVANVLNTFLDGLVLQNTMATEVKNRADIAVFGYGGGNVTHALSGALGNRDFVTLSDLKMNPLTIQRLYRRETDDFGAELQIPVDVPVWVQPVVTSNTPMCAALRKARDLAAGWAAQHPDNYPPVVVNVTDGMSTDGDPRDAAREIQQVATNDGAALLFNVHVSAERALEVIFPQSRDDLIQNEFAHQLFEMSSVVPEPSRAAYQAATNKTIAQGARGMIFNGDASAVRNMFVFATVAGLNQPDPNM
jgi:hypothetical protein